MTDDTKDPYENPKDLQGIKKVPLHLVPPSSTIYEAMAFLDGASKYDPFNWRDKRVVASVYLSACLRHLMLWWDGEDNARDSYLPHLAHAKACIGILIDAIETGNLNNDRPTIAMTADTMNRFNEDIASIMTRWERRLETQPSEETET